MNSTRAPLLTAEERQSVDDLPDAGSAGSPEQPSSPQEALVADVLTPAVDGSVDAQSRWAAVQRALWAALFSFLLFQTRPSFKAHMTAYHVLFTVLNCAPAPLTLYLCLDAWDVSVSIPHMNGSFPLSSVV